MKPIAPLMVEHRLIERMVELIGIELSEIERGKDPNGPFIAAAVDFFRTYADRTHHGKEEDILFRELSAKGLSAEHKKMVGELMEEHVNARKWVSALSEANARYSKGYKEELTDIISSMKELFELYPWHIEKEDRHFFIPAMSYLSEEEQVAMLREFYSFDRNMIHEKYRKVVEEHTNRRTY